MPFIGIAVMRALSGHQFLDFLVAPLVIAFPLLTWATIKVSGRVAHKQPIDGKYIVIYGIASAVLTAALSFYFILEAGLGHGTEPTGVFLKKCLFVSIVVFACPLVDLILHRYYLVSGPETAGRIKSAMNLTGAAFSIVAVVLLVQIIGPPLNAALRFGHPNTARALIRFGSDVNKRDRYRCTPLWYAVSRADPEMAALLFDRGAKLDSYVAAFGLVRAVETHNTELLQLLLDKGASPDTPYMGGTPLVWACLNKDMKMIKVLVDKGADINFKSRYPNVPYDGKSPLDIANESGDPQMVELLLGRGKEQ
jgi:hypothetical protein